jgi:hypothetical protein
MALFILNLCTGRKRSKLHAPETNYGTHCTIGQVGLGVALNVFGKRKYLVPAQNQTPDRPVQGLRHHTDDAMCAINYMNRIRTLS